MVSSVLTKKKKTYQITHQVEFLIISASRSSYWKLVQMNVECHGRVCTFHRNTPPAVPKPYVSTCCEITQQQKSLWTVEKWSRQWNETFRQINHRTQSGQKWIIACHSTRWVWRKKRGLFVLLYLLVGEKKSLPIQPCDENLMDTENLSNDTGNHYRQLIIIFAHYLVAE